MRNLSKYLSVKILLILIFMSFISSCSARVASPGIWIVNQSDNYIRNIKFNWNGYAVTSGFYADRTPSQGGSQNFILEKKSDLFGPVHLEWEDAEGKKIVKEFEFKKEQLPYFQNNQNPTKNFGRRTFDSIYFWPPNLSSARGVRKGDICSFHLTDNYSRSPTRSRTANA